MMSAFRSRKSIQHRARRRIIQIDARDGGFGAFEDNVLHLLHVDLFGLDSVEHLRQHAGTIAMTHHQPMGRRCAPGEIHDVGDLPVSLKALTMRTVSAAMASCA